MSGTADTSQLLNELERLAGNVSPVSNTPQKVGEPELDFRGNSLGGLTG